MNPSATTKTHGVEPRRYEDRRYEDRPRGDQSREDQANGDAVAPAFHRCA